jgi:hypothetical protein
MPADGIEAAHLAHGDLGMSRLEQLPETIQHVLVCKEGIAPPISGNGTFETSTNVRSIGRFRGKSGHPPFAIMGLVQAARLVR